MSEVVQQPPTPTIEQSLNKTDLGHEIYEHRKYYIAGLILIVVAALGFSFWKQMATKNKEESSVKVFEFQTKVWSQVKTQKLTTDELIKGYRDLSADVKKSPVMLPLAFEMSKYLVEQNKLAEADEVLSAFEVGQGSAITSTFVAFQRAVVLESLTKVDDAIALLEKVAQNKDSILKPKLYLEIGRLSLLKGDKVKAKTNFDYVIGNYPNDEYAKLAKLYLPKAL